MDRRALRRAGLPSQGLSVFGPSNDQLDARERWRTRPSLRRPRPIKCTYTQGRCRLLRARSDQKITTDPPPGSPRPIGLGSREGDATALGMRRRTVARYSGAGTTRSSTSMRGHGRVAAPHLLPRPRTRLLLPTTAGRLPSRSTRPPPPTPKQQTPLTTAPPTQETVQRLRSSIISDRASSTCPPRRREEGRLPDWEEGATRPALRMSTAAAVVVGSDRRPGTPRRAAAAQ